LSKHHDSLYTGPPELDAFDLATFPDSEEAKLGGNAFLAPGDLQYFEDTLRLHHPSTSGLLVDLGCGRGALGRHLAQRLAMPLVGIDASRVALEQARTFPTTVQARWLECDFCDTNLETASAAAIISIDGVSLAVDPRTMLREVARISMPGAPLIFTGCVPRLRGGGLDWQSVLREHHFTVLEHHDVSQEWREWIKTRHERRLRSATELARRMEERQVATALAESRALVGGARPWFDSQRRYRITARYEGAPASR
jgi:ubiquinone/menaquinone biosynthesis C-methylase UbiE